MKMKRELCLCLGVAADRNPILFGVLSKNTGAIAPDIVPPAKSNFNASAVSTYSLVVASAALVGADSPVMVPAVPELISSVPVIVRLLNVLVPLEAMLPVTLPKTLPVRLPVTLPDRLPVMPPVADSVVK